MPRSPRLLLASFLVLSLHPACAYYSQEDGERLNNEVYSLMTQVNALQQSLSELQTAEKQDAQKIDELMKEVGELSKAARRNDADIGVQLEEMLQDFARIKGNVEQFNERMSTLETGVSKVTEELQVRFQGLADKSRIDTAKTEEEKAKVLEDTKRRERLLSDPPKLFAEVERLLSGGEPKEARKLTREFMLRAEQEKPLRKHLAKAQLMIGESYYAEQQWQQAAAEYNAVRKNHPSADAEVAKALFKLGRCFEELKLKNDAKLFYETVVQKYSKHSVAKEAKARLKELK